MQTVYDPRLFDMDEERMEPRAEAFHLHNPMDPEEERLGKIFFRYGVAISAIMLAGAYFCTL